MKLYRLLNKSIRAINKVVVEFSLADCINSETHFGVVLLVSRQTQFEAFAKS